MHNQNILSINSVHCFLQLCVVFFHNVIIAIWGRGLGLNNHHIKGACMQLDWNNSTWDLTTSNYWMFGILIHKKTNTIWTCLEYLNNSWSSSCSLPVWGRVLTFHVAIFVPASNRSLCHQELILAPLSWCMAVGVALFNPGDDWASMDSLLFVCIICSVCLWHCLCLAGPNPLSARSQPKIPTLIGLALISDMWLSASSWSHLPCCWPEPANSSTQWCHVNTTLSHSLAYQKPAHKRFGNWMRTSAACPL